MFTIKKAHKRLLRMFHILAMTTLTLSFMLGFLVVAPPGAQAQIPRYINYQGKLTDANDNPVTGDIGLTVRLYDAETGGTAIWTETQTTTVSNGVFSVLLGNSATLDDLDFNSPYWYSIEIESDGEMEPRQRLTAVGYAINADKIDGYDAADFLASAPTGALNLTGGANENVEVNPTGTGDVVITIDATSGDFRITDGTTNWVLVDHSTGNMTVEKDLTVNGTIYGTIASTGGSSTFSTLTVTGESDLKGNISNSGASNSGAVTIADALTQTGAANQVTFAGNVDAGNGIDVTGALTVSGQTTLSNALNMNSNIDLAYSGESTALSVSQSGEGASAEFTGGKVVIGDGAANANATGTGELYVQGDMEVDGTIYGNVSSSGGTSNLGATTVDSLTVTGTSDLKGNVSNSTGVFTIADNMKVTHTDTSYESGEISTLSLRSTYQDGGTDSATTAIGLNIAPTVNYTGASKTGSYTALKISATETSLPTGSNYLIDAYAGADGATQKFYVDNSGNAKIFGALDMNSQKITSLATPTNDTDAATKAYVDLFVPSSAGGWTKSGAGVYLSSNENNVGIGTSVTDTYKLDVSGAANVTNLYIAGTAITSTADELNKLDGYTGTAANLNTLTNTSNADSLHTHTASSLTGNVISSLDGVTNDGGNVDLIAGSNVTITPDDEANTITIASQASGDEIRTTNLTFTINSDNAGLAVANGTGIVLEGGTGDDASVTFNAATNNIDIAGVTGGLNIQNGALYKINGSQIASSDLSNDSNLPKLDDDSIITGNWDNKVPWSDEEVANDITASNYLPLAGGTMTGDITLSGAGTNIITSGINLDLSPALGYGVTSTVTRSADTGDETAYDLAATISKATSGNYTGIKLNVTESPAPGADDKLLDLQVGGESKFTVDNAGLVTTASVNSTSVVNNSLTAEDLNVNVISSLNSLTNDGGNITIAGGAGIDVTSAGQTVTIASTDNVATQEALEDFVGGMVSGNAETNIDVTYDDENGKMDFAVTGVPVLDPAVTQTITAGATDATPLILKGMAGQTANLIDVQDSGAVSHLTVNKDGDIKIDTSGAAALPGITQTDISTSLAIAADTTKAGGGAGSDSDGLLKLGINDGNYQYIWYDTNAGTDNAGAFVFSDQAVIPTASPAYLNFGMDKNAETGRYGSYYAVKVDPDPDDNSGTNIQKFSVVNIPNPGADWKKSEQSLFDISSDGSFNIYDPTLGDAVFQIEPGGRLAHDFRNIIKNGSFEAFSGFERFIGYDPGYDQTVYTSTTTAYRGGWSNFAPDEWTWLEGRIVQHSPALFATSGTGIFNTDFFDGKSAVAINEPNTPVNKRGLNYALRSPGSGNDSGIKQVIKGLEPNTWYSIGAALMTTNSVTTKAILDITGAYEPTATLGSNIDNQPSTLSGAPEHVITVNSTDDFPSGGTILINNELFDYKGKTSTSFTSVTRAVNGTSAASHTSGTAVYGIFKPLIGETQEFDYKKGTFKTNNTGSDITIYLLCQQTGGATNIDFARFDAIQLVEGKVLPKYGPSSIVDTGDQSIYGTLKLGRSADGRGGILSVDQYVRTRGIDFFVDDPGLSGTTGGSGSIGTPYSLLSMIYGTDNVSSTNTPGTVRMDTSGNYVESITRKFQVRVQGTYDTPTGNIKYRTLDSLDPLANTWVATWSDWSSDIDISSITAGDEVNLNYGVKVKFSDTTGYKGGDQWEFKAFGMTAGQQTYNSFDRQTSYMSSEARIFRDEATGELTFEDSKAGKVKLSEIISQKTTGYISPPARDPANMGTTNITVSGALNSTAFTTGQNFEVWIEWDTGKFGWGTMWTPGSTGTYTWYGNWNQTISLGEEQSLISSTGTNTGIKVKFPTSATLYNYERWRFYASPSQAGSSDISGTSSPNFTIFSGTTNSTDSVILNFGASQPQKFIKWNGAISSFDISNNVNIQGTLTAQNLSGPTSTSGTSNDIFYVNTDIAGGAAEPVQGSGFIIEGGTGDVGMVYDANNDYLNVTGVQAGLNIPSGTKYKIGGNDLAPNHIGAAPASHSHVATDLPLADAGAAGIIPSTGLTDGMVSATAGIQTSKLYDSAALLDAMNKRHSQGTDTTLGTMTSNINMNNFQVTGLGVPTQASDATTKTYVDSAIAGLKWKQSVKAATTTNGDLATAYENGDTIDTVGLITGDRILIKDQLASTQNGIYIVNATGAPTRAADADTAVELKQAAVFIEQGSPSNDDTAWVCSNDSITIGSTNILFAQFTGAAAYTWGDGLTNDGNTINIDSTVATLTGNQILTNKTIDGDTNTLQDIADASLKTIATANKVSGSAVQLRAGGAITDSTGLGINLQTNNPGLAITDNMLDAKISANQGITKIADGMAVDYDNSTIGIVANKLAVKSSGISGGQIAESSITSSHIFNGTIVNEDISGTANIDQSKLNLAIKDGQVANDASISQSKLNLAITNVQVDGNAGIATSKLSGAVTSIANHGLGGLATLSAVSGGNEGTITDGTITNIDISDSAAIKQSKLDLAIRDNEVAAVANIATTKIKGAVTSIVDNGLGGLATLSAVDANTITDGSITASDISGTAGILDSQLATSPTTRFYENFAEYVESGLLPAVDAGLSSDISAGTAYVRGARINKTTAVNKTYTINSDTYVDIDSSSAFQYTAVANGAASPSVAANSIRLAKVVTDGTGILSVTDLRNLYPVTANEIAPGAVTSTNIEDGSIGTTKLADSAVTSVKIADGTITNDDINVNAGIAITKISGLGSLAPLSSVTSGYITNGAIVNEDVNANANIAWTKIDKTGALPGDIGAAAGSHTHNATDLSGVIKTAPQETQTIQPGADVIPLTIKGQASASANSNVLSIYDSAATPVEKIYVDKAGHMHVAENTAVDESAPYQDSSATLYFGRNSVDNWETITYDPNLGETEPKKGKFTFSAPLQVEASSPTGITFVEKDTGGNIIKSQGLTYDPALDEFSFTGGTLKQAFQNLAKNPSFETSMPMGWVGLMSSYGYAISSTQAKFGAKSVIVNDSDPSANNGIKSMISALDPDWARLKGKTITLSLWAKADSAVTTSVAFDALGTEFDTDTNNEIVPEQYTQINLTTTWQNFKFSYDVPSNAVKLNIILYGAVYSETEPNTYMQNIYFDGITLVEGKLALDYGPAPIFDTGNQVVYGSLAIGANYNPETSTNYYESPRLVFGQPDTYFGGGYGGWASGSGEIRFMKWDENNAGTFIFNRGVWLRDDYGSNYGATLRIGNSISPNVANARGDIFAKGRLELAGKDNANQNITNSPILTVGTGTVNFANTGAGNAYIAGKLEVDGGIYGDGSNIININSAVQLNPAGAIVNDTGLKINLPGSNPGLLISGNALDVKLSANQGLTKTENGMKVDYDNSTIGIVNNKLALVSAYADGSTYDARFVNADGDIMNAGLGKNLSLLKTSTALNAQNITEYDLDISREITEPDTGSATWAGAVARIQNLSNISGSGTLTNNTAVMELDQNSSGDILVIKSDGNQVVTVAKTGDIVLGLGADTITSAASNDFNIKLGDTAGANKFSLQTSAGVEKLAMYSDGALKINGGYTGSTGGGITLQPNGDIYFAGNLYQGGTIYTVDTVRFTGNYDVGVTAKFGVGQNGGDTDFLQIDQDGVITKAGNGSGGAVTVNDIFTQAGSSNQVTFQGNVDAQNSLDVTGDITVSGKVDGIDISSDSWVTSSKIADGNVGNADLADNAVTTVKIDEGAVAKSKILELRPYATTPAPNNRVNIAAGIISVSNNEKVEFAGGQTEPFDPVTANSRIDLIAVDSSGNLVSIPGFQAVSPVPPFYPTDKLVVAEVTIDETAVQGVVITSADIKDVRPFLNLGSGSGNSSINTTDSVIFTIGRTTNEAVSDVTLAFGDTAGGQKTLVYQGSTTDDFALNDDLSLGSNSLKFTNNTLTDARVGSYDSHLSNTSNPHAVTAAQIGGTNIVSEINAAGTQGTISANRLASEVLTESEASSAYLSKGGGTISGDLAVTGTLSPTTISMPSEANITWATAGKTVITPEYNYSIIYADGTSNNGTMSVNNTEGADMRNYYEWSTQNPGVQDYTIMVRYELPNDFDKWALANAIKLSYITDSLASVNNKIDVTIYKSGSNEPIVSSVDNVSAVWTDIVIDDSSLGSWNPGDILMIEIKMYSRGGNTSKVGDITINYTR